MCVCAYMHVYVHIYVYLYVYGCMCVNVCLYMCIIMYFTDCVCFMDFDIWTADGDLIVLVYINKTEQYLTVDINNNLVINCQFENDLHFRMCTIIHKIE